MKDSVFFIYFLNNKKRPSVTELLHSVVCWFFRQHTFPLLVSLCVITEQTDPGPGPGPGPGPEPGPGRPESKENLGKEPTPLTPQRATRLPPGSSCKNLHLAVGFGDLSNLRLGGAGHGRAGGGIRPIGDAVGGGTGPGLGRLGRGR